MQFPINIGLHRSRLLDVAVFLSVFSANLVTMVCTLPVAIQGAVLLAIWLCGTFAWCRLSPQCSSVRLERNGHVAVTPTGTEEFSMAKLIPGGIVHQWLTVARLKSDSGRVCMLIVTTDSLKSEDFRRLRVFLRWQANFNGGSDCV